jgi:hypothetical protein
MFSLQRVGSGSSHVVIVTIAVAVVLSRTVIGCIVVDAAASCCRVAIVALCYRAAVALSRPSWSRILCRCCDRGGGCIVVVVIAIAIASLSSCPTRCGRAVVVVITVEVVWSLSRSRWCSPCCYRDRSHDWGSTASRKCRHFPRRGSRRPQTHRRY